MSSPAAGKAHAVSADAKNTLPTGKALFRHLDPNKYQPLVASFYAARRALGEPVTKGNIKADREQCRQAVQRHAEQLMGAAEKGQKDVCLEFEVQGKKMLLQIESPPKDELFDRGSYNRNVIAAALEGRYRRISGSSAQTVGEAKRGKARPADEARAVYKLIS